MPKRRYVFQARNVSKSLFTERNLIDFLGGRVNYRRACRFTYVKPNSAGHISEDDARKLIVAHRGGLFEILMGKDKLI